MSRFLSATQKDLVPYVPGEQPRDRSYIKLNTNESPFPPSAKAQAYAAQAAKSLQLYSDPNCTALTAKAAQLLGVEPENIIFTNGSDEALYFVFLAFCDGSKPAIFPDITYGFYKVYAELTHVPYTRIPLKEDFTIDIADYAGNNATIFIANPNAPTGLLLGLDQVEAIVKANPDNIVVIDEAYIDFGGESAVTLIDKYDNLLVVQTFSKSRSMAGARLGLAIGNKALIDDMKAIKYSTNPFNVNAMTMAAGLGSLEDGEYFRSNCEKIRTNRSWTTQQLRDRGFTVLDSTSNFILAKHPLLPGKQLYLDLKAKGILIRHFDTQRLTDYIRITIGSSEEMAAFVKTIDAIMEETL